MNMRTPPPMAEMKKLAALIFEDGEEANAIVEPFARELAGAGRRIAGVIQLADTVAGCDCRDQFIYDVETGETHSILQDLGKEAVSCRIDPAAIAQAAHRIGAAIERGPELLFINRFGKLEVEGKGLSAEIGAAALAGIPTLVCVAARYADQWREFAADLAEELPCSAEALRLWWSAVSIEAETLRAAS